MLWVNRQFHLDLLLVSRELPHHIHPRDSDLASTPDVRKRVGEHACAHVRTRAACPCVASPRARAHGSPARTWSHAKPCTHDCSDQTQLGSARFVVAPLQRRRAVALQRCAVACRTSHGARRMPLGTCGMAACYGFAWRTCALDADALVGAAVGGGVGGGVGPAGGVQVTVPTPLLL